MVGSLEGRAVRDGALCAYEGNGEPLLLEASGSIWVFPLLRFELGEVTA